MGSETWILINKCRTEARQIKFLRAIKFARGYMRAYPEVSGLAAWCENCKWYSSLPLDAVASLFYESV
jgi:hypothetical protein